MVTGFKSPNVAGPDTRYPRVSQLTERGFELLTEFKNRPRGVSERDAVAQYIAGLGADGWELVNVSDNGSYSTWYFKRVRVG